MYLGCTQRQCQISKGSVDNYRTMFESRISAGRTEKLPFSENLRISSWSSDMAGHAKKCVERYCELANKTTQQLHKVSTPCIDDHHFKEEELKSVGELSQVCSQIVLKCLYLARIGRLDILWSLNKLARSITKWTKACDKRLNRLISYIHHTCEYRQYCHVVKFNYVFQPCNDTFQFGVIVPTSYDEYTALVKSGNVASKHVNGWRVRSKRQI